MCQLKEEAMERNGEMPDRRVADRRVVAVAGSVGDDVKFYHLLSAVRDAYTTANADVARQELIAYLDSRCAPAGAPSVDRNSVLEEAAKECAAWSGGDFHAEKIRALKIAAPQPVDAAQAVPEGEIIAYLHQVVSGEGEPDQALSFMPDNFPLSGTLGYRSISHQPLYATPAAQAAHLTDFKIRSIADNVSRARGGWDDVRFARAVLAAQPAAQGAAQKLAAAETPKPVATMLSRLQAIDGHLAECRFTERHAARQLVAAMIIDLAAQPAPAPSAGADVEKDAARLDWLDSTNARFRMGWQVGCAPAGNLSVKSIITGGTTIRDAIDAAMLAASSPAEAG